MTSKGRGDLTVVACAALAVALWVGAGCSSENTGGDTGETVAADALDASTEEDIATDVALPETVEPDIVVEVDGSSPTGFGWPDCEEDGQPGCPCAENSDCLSEFCVPSGDGLVCSKTCEDDCPAGWSCKLVDSASGDQTYICVDLFMHLCRPCDTGEDCAQQGGTGGYCLESQDGSGSFCGGSCEDDASCPDGYVCTDIEGLMEEPVKQCVPAGGGCTCNATAIKEEASTACLVVNDLGSCSGERSCGPNGLTTCVGQIPGPEECDGMDNDCDEDIDEGFGDSDLDGISDCLDDDIDGDGLLNEDDNCESVPNPNQEDLDGDGLGDICDPDDDGDFVPDSSDCFPQDPGEACTYYYFDADKDGSGMCSEKQCLCGPTGSYTVPECLYSDCDDTDPTKGTGLPDTCDGIDNNCNGEVDEGCEPASVQLTFHSWVMPMPLSDQVPVGAGYSVSAAGGETGPVGALPASSEDAMSVDLGFYPAIVFP